jgi:TetR/AcrR family transcriptional regulator, regulator of biofilm formation and stress response
MLDDPDVTSTGPRRVDRGRRQRIIDATLQVITEQGFSNLSHRRVANVAGVPLSATSYYFGTLDELVEAAFTEAVEHDRALMRARLEELPIRDDPVAAIVSLVCELIADRESGVLAMELFVAALRHDNLRPLAHAWDDSFREALTPYLGELPARLVVAVMTGVVQRGLVADPPMTVEEITSVVRAGLLQAER